MGRIGYKASLPRLNVEFDGRSQKFIILFLICIWETGVILASYDYSLQISNHSTIQ